MKYIFTFLLVLLLLLFTPFLMPLERWSYDMRHYVTLPSRNSDIAIIDIDSETLKSWKKEKMEIREGLIEILQTLKEVNPKKVIVDIIMDTKTEVDSSLFNVIGGLREVYIPSKLIEDLKRINVVSGSIELNYDPDGIIRLLPLSKKFLAFLVSNKYRKGYIRYYKNDFFIVPATIFLKNRDVRKEMYNKTIFIGVTDPEMHDYHSIPVYKKVAGVKIIATVYANIVNGDFIKNIPSFLNIIILILFSFSPLFVGYLRFKWIKWMLYILIFLFFLCLIFFCIFILFI